MKPRAAERLFESRLPRQCCNRVRGPRFTISGPRRFCFFLARRNARKKETYDQRVVSVFQEETRATWAPREVGRSTEETRGSRREKISVAFPVASFSRHFSSPVRWPRLRYHPPCGFGRSNLWHSEPRRSLRRSVLRRGRIEEYSKNRWMVSSYCYHEMQQPRCMDRCTGGGCRFDGKPVGSSRNLASHPTLPGTRGTRSWNVRAYIPCWSIPCELLTYKEWQSMLTRWGGVRWQWGAESSCRRSRSRGRHQRT